MSTSRLKSDLIDNFDTASDWIGDSGRSSGSDAMPFGAGVCAGNVAFAAGVVTTDPPPQLTTLVSFTDRDGAVPEGSLIADAAGDLFGTTFYGGSHGVGTVFEIDATKGGYASAPSTLINFTVADGLSPAGSLIADAAGDLFGTTDLGPGDSGDGEAFEIAKSKKGYASAPKILAGFTGSNGGYLSGSLIADAAGDLFGTTQEGGADNDGTVFEIAKTKKGYATAPTTLVSFTGTDGTAPAGSLIADAAGDLFGTTQGGGADSDGTVFEIAKTKKGYATAPTTLVSFTSEDGKFPIGSLIADAAGDLFGTTESGGPNNSQEGTVFEIAKTKQGYASAPTTLVSFTGADGMFPSGSLIADAAGDLFGTTYSGGADDEGTVFEIVKVNGGYASAPTILVSFTGANGAEPAGSLISDAAGNLFGTTTAGGPDDAGTVFEITNSGFVMQQPAAKAAVASAPAAANVTHALPRVSTFVQAMAATIGHHEATGLFNASMTEPGHQPMLAMPRLAIA